MKVLLVTKLEKLAENLAALNPELEYCAIVIDECEPAKEILSNIGLSSNLLYPMSELKNCLEKINYDYVLLVQNHLHEDKETIMTLPKYGVPLNKILSFTGLSSNFNFLTERALRYYQDHCQDFEMFDTGISETYGGIDVTQFKRKLFNIAKPSQDLYYDYNIAKYIFLCGEGYSKIRYTLIGLAPYSFHYNLAQVLRYRFLLLNYFIAFNDLHNFFMPTEVYKKFLREEWLAKRLSMNRFNPERPYGTNPIMMNIMDQKAIDGATLTWRGKSYPETRDDNIKILDDYLTLCEKNNARPIMFRVPVSEKMIANFNKEILDEFDILVEQALQKHPSARFVDGWKMQGLTYADFRDHEHVNVHGAAKFSSHLNDFIEQLEAQGR